MNKLYNKHGPDHEIGYKVSGHASDCTGRMPRDGTGRMPRDGTGRMPRDGTGRMPRDGTIRATGNKVISHFNLIAQLPGGYHIRGRTQFRRRKTIRKTGLWDR